MSRAVLRDPCPSGGMHVKRMVNGVWTCTRCTHHCSTGCGRQVATADSRCIRCENGQDAIAHIAFYPSTPSLVEG